MVPRPLYCASLALSFSRVGNAPADTTNIETTTATPAARDAADRADFSRYISLPPPKPLFPYLAANISSGSTSPHLVMSRNKRTSPPTAKPHRLSAAPGNYAYVFLHTLVSISASSSLRLSLVSTSPVPGDLSAFPLVSFSCSGVGFYARGETFRDDLLKC